MKDPGGTGGWLRATMLVVLALAGAIALALSYVALNPNALKPIAGYLCETLLGRTLIIGGDVTLEVSLEPRVSVSQVRFANAAWSTHPDMASAGYLLVQIDLLELFHRRVRLMDLDVQNGELRLENPVAERPNWTFGGTDSGDQDDGGGPDWSFILEGLEVKDSNLFLELGELEPIEVRIPRLVESTDADGYLTLDGEGTFNGRRWQTRGRLGTFDELLAAGHIDLKGDLAIEDVTLSVAGSVGDLARLTPLDLSVQLHGPDARLFGTLFRTPEIFTGDVSLDARIRPSGSVHDVAVQGHIAQFSIDMKGTIRDPLGFDGWDGTVAVSGPDAGVIARALQIETLPGGPFEVSAIVHRDGGDLDLTDVDARLSGARLKLAADFAAFPDPKGARINASLTGDDLGHYRKFLRLPALPADLPFDAEIALDAPTNALTSTVTVGRHTLRATGVLGGVPDFSGTRLKLSASGQDIAELARFAGRDIPLKGPYQAQTVLTLADGGFSATDTELQFDPLTLTGAIRIPDLDQPRRLSVDGTLDARDLTLVRTWLDRADLPSGTLSMTATVSSDGRSWLLERATGRLVRLDFSASGKLGTLTSLRGIDIRTEIRGPDINVLFDHALPDTEEVPFSLASRVLGADGAVDLKGFELHAEGGELKLDSHISLVKDLVGSRLSLSGHGLNLAHLIPSFPGYEPSQQPWKIGGTFSIPSTGHVEIRDGNVQVGSIQIEASGVMDVREQEQTDLALTVSGTTLNDIGQIAHLNWPDIPFSVNAALDGTTDAINISRFDARLGTSDLTATGALELAGKPRIALHGTSSLLKIDEIQQAFPDQPATSDGGPKRFIPDTPLPLLLLASQDVDLTVKTARFEARRLKLDDVDLAVKIQDGALELDRLRYRDQDAYFDASGSLRPTAGAGMAQLVLKVTGKDADLGLFTSPDQARETVPKYNLDIAIDGTGSTLAELAGNLNGSILVWSDGGQINNNVVQTFASDFLVNVLDTLNPFTQSEPFTPLQCMVLNGIIESGKMNLQPGFVMRTNRLNMFVVGDVNLRTEKLNLSLATQARQGIGISAATLTNPYFKIGGTLSAPQLQLDAQSATIAASVTAATAGLSIVVRGVWSRLMGEQNPCPQFLNYERKSAQSATGNRQQK